MRRTMIFSSTSFWLLFISFSSFNYASETPLYQSSSPSRYTRDEKPATNNPVILTKPQEITFREGETAVLPCDVKDLYPLLMLWLKHPESALYAGIYKIKTDSRLELISEEKDNVTMAKMTIKGVQIQDSGKYICRVGSKVPTEIVHNLIVIGPPHVRTYPETGVLSLRKGENINLTCIATGNPLPKVSWRKREGQLPEGVENEGESLIIKNASRYDIGIYECTASNIAHGEMTQTFRVQVYYEPEIHVQHSIVYSGVNQSAVLACDVYSEPSATVSWSRKNGPRIEPSDKYLIFKNSTISLMTLKIEGEADFGDYVCFANNSQGNSSASIELVGKPSETKITSESIVYTENEYLLSWEVTSYSPITRYVIRFRKDVNGNDWNQSEFLPTEVQEGPIYSEKTLLTFLTLDRYVIQIQAENEFGWNRPNKEFSFTLLGPQTTKDNALIERSSYLIRLIIAMATLFSYILL